MIFGELTLGSLSNGVKYRITTEKSSFTLTKSTMRRFRLEASKGSAPAFTCNLRYLLQSCDIKTIGWGKIVVGKRFAFIASGALCITTKIVRIERVWEGD